MREFFCKWWCSWLPFGDMKVTNIWKIIFRFWTFQQWYFRGQQVLTNCWPVQWSPNVKIHFLTIFRKNSGYWRGSQSNPAEKFWEEIWSFSTCRNSITIIIFNKTFFSENWNFDPRNFFFLKMWFFNFFFKVHTSSWEGYYGLKGVNLDQNHEFLHVRTHTWKNSSRWKKLKTGVFVENRALTRLTDMPFRQHVLTRCYPKWYGCKVCCLSFQTHVLPCPNDA